MGDLRLANLAIMRKPDVLLFIMGIAAASAFRCGPGHFTMCRGTSASLRMTQQDPTETIEVADAGGAAMSNLQRRLGAKKKASIYPQKREGKFPVFLVSRQARANVQTLGWGVKEVEEAKKSAVAIAVLLVLIQPLSLAGYYASAYDPGDFAGTILKSPRLCTTTVERCEEKIAKKKLDADRYRAFKNGRIVFY